jgi:RNA polymerase sigma-70 factor, ECF subfamily
MADQYRLLMARYQAGEGAAFEELYGRLAPVLPQMVRAVDPDACVHEAVEGIFLSIHHARGSYDPRRPFEPWLTAIVHHVTDLRRRRRQPRSSLGKFLGRQVAPRSATAAPAPTSLPGPHRRS